MSTAKGVLSIITNGGGMVRFLQLQCQDNQAIRDCKWNEPDYSIWDYDMIPLVIPLPASYQVECETEINGPKFD